MNALKRLIREIHRRSLWQVLAIYLAAVVESVRDERSLSIPSDLPGNPVFRPWALALAGDAEGALEGLRAYQERGLGTTAVFWMPSVQRLLGDEPRFQALLEEIGIDG